VLYLPLPCQVLSQLLFFGMLVLVEISLFIFLKIFHNILI